MPSSALRCEFLGLSLASPLVLASGILGTSTGVMTRVAGAGAGMITAKSCGPVPRSGHTNPVALDWGGGVINAIGLTNPGVEAEVAVLQATRARLQPLGVPLIASIFAGTVEEFADVTRIINRAEPDLLEVNISCPNVRDEFGTPFAATAETAAAVTAAVKREATCPITVKLAPNVPSIARIAVAVVEAGADAITAINTMPGMIIDADAGEPVLTNRSGGLSGPALKPIALKAVYDIARAVTVPIIGTGGISTGRDAAEMLMAGATVVGVGTAVYQRGVSAFTDINTELADFIAARQWSLAQLKGMAQE